MANAAQNYPQVWVDLRVQLVVVILLNQGLMLGSHTNLAILLRVQRLHCVKQYVVSVSKQGGMKNFKHMQVLR